MEESLGSYYVRKDRTKTGWRLMRESWINGKRLQKTVPAELWPSLGFHHFLTLEQARQRCREVNQGRSFEREQRREHLKRVYRKRAISSIHLPTSLVEGFTEYLKSNQTGSDEHLDKILCHWQIVQEIIRDLQIEPSEYHLRAKVVYSYFIRRKLSLDYSNKLIRMLNMWGQWSSFRLNKAFLPLKAPKGNDREKIVDANADKEGRRREAVPLTEKMLDQLRNKLSIPEFNWVYISFYFGLRPTEVEQLHRPTDDYTFQIHDLIQNGTAIQVLAVYQTKLVARKRDKRWKYIPVILPEQVKALEMIRSGEFSKPRQLKLHIRGAGLYSGRKGFKNFMQSKGQSIENISKWLGHSTTRITETRYDDLQSVHFDEIREMPHLKIKR